jgi:ABC-type methionine transport system ATPase subunit
MADRRVKLTYPQALVDQPILHQMIGRFGLLTNIHRAEVNDAGGWLVVDLRGEEETINRALDWLRQLGIEVRDQVQ